MTTTERKRRRTTAPNEAAGVPVAAATTYMLRTCNADGTSYGGFRWSEPGPVEAPDWSPVAECGNGLHGLLLGTGDGNLLDWSEDARWIVCEIAAGTPVVAIGDGKVKVPRCTVIYCGARDGAIALLRERGADPSTMVLGSVASTGYRGQATASGDRGQATASGDCGQATASGYCGQATASGYRGQATASGDCGQATAGENGIVTLRWWDAATGRYRLTIGYVGEHGVKPNFWYRCGDDGSLIEVGPAVTGVTP